MGAASFIAGTSGLAGYAFAVEPMRTVVTRYRSTPPGWPADFPLKIAVLADIHACEPWMSAERISGIVAETNRLQADIVMLLGDYVGGMSRRWVSASVPNRDWAEALAGLRAPLGVHAVLGNHDWWDDGEAQARGAGPTAAGWALERVGIPVYENTARRLVKDGRPFWLLGLGDQIAIRLPRVNGRRGTRGVDDLAATLAQISDDAPAILMAHEPDMFPQVTPRISLTLSGHTHGGQVRIGGVSLVEASRHGQRFLYGHVRESRKRMPGEAPRHIIISGGLGCSGLPVRFGVPPEIVLVELGGAARGTV